MHVKNTFWYQMKWGEKKNHIRKANFAKLHETSLVMCAYISLISNLKPCRHLINKIK